MSWEPTIHKWVFVLAIKHFSFFAPEGMFVVPCLGREQSTICRTEDAHNPHYTPVTQRALKKNTTQGPPPSKPLSRGSG